MMQDEGGMGSVGYGSVVNNLYIVVKDRLSNEMTWEQKPESGEGANHVVVWDNILFFCMFK